MNGNYCHFSKRSQMLHVLCILIEEQCEWWFCSVCPPYDVIQVEMTSHQISLFSFWYFPFNNWILLGCIWCCKIKNYTQVLFITLFLETSVFSTDVKPYSLHLNSILSGHNLDPHWYHSNLVTFLSQKKL